MARTESLHFIRYSIDKPPPRFHTLAMKQTLVSSACAVFGFAAMFALSIPPPVHPWPDCSVSNGYNCGLKVNYSWCVVCCNDACKTDADIAACALACRDNYTGH